MTNRRYTVSNLLAALAEPSLFVYELERLASKALFTVRYGPGIDVMEQDWDNLVILDACRTDHLEAYDEFDGELAEVVSKGSTTREFIDENFAGRTLHDTVIITANPFIERVSDDVFFRVHYTELFDRWDESLKTIPPEAVVDAAVRMNERYPDKRLIAHFMQPHTPYIGPTGRELNERFEFGVFNPEIREREGFEIPLTGIPQAVEVGAIDDDELRRAYAENVEISMEHAEELVERLDGKSVITSDHGEMLGERVLLSRKYSHGYGIYTPELRVVPWLVVEADERRTITEGPPSGSDRLDDELRERRLHALGYA